MDFINFNFDSVKKYFTEKIFRISFGSREEYILADPEGNKEELDILRKFFGDEYVIEEGDERFRPSKLWIERALRRLEGKHGFGVTDFEDAEISAPHYRAYCNAKGYPTDLYDYEITRDILVYYGADRYFNSVYDLADILRDQVAQGAKYLRSEATSRRPRRRTHYR